jgi:hypothetical protein
MLQPKEMLQKTELNESYNVDDDSSDATGD